MRKKLLFLALILAATLTATSRPSAAAAKINCGPRSQIYYCGEDVICCPNSQWPSCICP